MKFFIVALALVALASAGSIAKKTRGHDAMPVMQQLKRDVKRWVDNFPTLRRLIDNQAERSSETIKTITGRGFTYFSQTASMQAIEGVEEESYDDFANYMIEALQIPTDQRQTVMNELFQVIKFAENSDWVQHKMMFSVDKGGSTKYICILGHSNFGDKTYDFVVADFKTSFRLAPDILVIQERKSYLWGLIKVTKTRRIEIPASLKPEEIENLTNFFDMAAFTRFAQMLDVPVPQAVTAMDGYHNPYLDPISIIGAVNAGLNLWGTITNLFKTEIKNEIVKTFVRDGFSHYTQDSSGHILERLRESFFPRYMEMAPSLYKIGPEYSEEFKFNLELALYTDKTVWNKHDTIFKINTIGTNKFVDLLTHNNEDGTLDIMVLECKQEFKLAPNIIVTQKSRSILGGIYADSKLEYKEQPRDLTDKDMEMLMAFFHIVTFKRFAARLGINIDKPDPEIKA